MSAPDTPEKISDKSSSISVDQLTTHQNNYGRKINTNGFSYDTTGAMQKIINDVEKFARSRLPVLIVGKTGTGKEKIARFLHQGSKDSDKPFVALNCAAISPGLIESELFGHEKGAFTGAFQQRLGAFERADGGTLFLDEITEMPLDAQAKLLRVLQEGEVIRVGGNELIKARPRIIAATNRNPVQAVKDGKLRQDLYYRLNFVNIHLPALKDRPVDIPLLAGDFIKKEVEGNKDFKMPSLSQEALDALKAYHWPGNIRQLEGVIARAVIEAQYTPDVIITPEMLNLPKKKKIEGGHTHRLSLEPEKNGLKRSAEDIKEDIKKLFENDKGKLNIREISKATGIARGTLDSFFNPENTSRPNLATVMSLETYCGKKGKMQQLHYLVGELLNVLPNRHDKGNSETSPGR